MIPIESKWTIIVRLIFVLYLELEWYSDARKAHEGIIVGEFPYCEMYWISEIFFLFFCNSKGSILTFNNCIASIRMIIP
jgi:hypothetical protein